MGLFVVAGGFDRLFLSPPWLETEMEGLATADIFRSRPGQLIPLGLFGLVLILGWQTLSSYFQPGFNQWVCLLVAPFLIRVRVAKPRFLYGILATLSLGAYGLTGMKTFFLLGVGFYVFFLVEQWIGRLGWLPLVLLLLYQPVLSYLISAFSFPLRLELSALTAKFLQFAGFAVEVQGNMFTVDGTIFAVDRACMGMKSLSVGLIILTLLIAFVSRQHQKTFPFSSLVPIYLLGLGLLVFAGFMRMLVLVLLRSMPETLSHEMIGLGSMVVYMILPMYGLLMVWARRLADERFHRQPPGSSPGQAPPAADRFSEPQAYPPLAGAGGGKRPIGLILSLILLLFIAALNHSRQSLAEPLADPLVEKLQLPGLERRILPSGVAQFRDADQLIYVKPAVRFWGADHNPETCWRASGYEFSHIETLIIENEQVWQARLIQENDTLYTAWWYENEQERTHQQWQWRWQMLKGSPPFRLVNLTTARPEELYDRCLYYQKHPLLVPER
jgi:hypothetical protein